MEPFEIRSNNSIRIGEHVYRAFVEHNPKPGFHIYSIEAVGRPDGEFQQKFHFGDLTAVFARDLPESFSLSVYDPKLRVKCIDGLWVQKHEGQCELTISFIHLFKDWHLPQNLHHFYRDLQAALLKNPPYPSDVTIDKQDYGWSAWVKSEIENQQDISTHIFKMVDYIEKVIEEKTLTASSASVRPDTSGTQAKLKPDEDGWKWWVRYVVVPLGVTAAAAILAFTFKSIA